MTLNKKQKDELKELIKISQTEFTTPVILTRAIRLIEDISESHNKLSEKISVLKQSNSDLNAAIQKRNLEIELFNKKQCSADRERSYDEWTKGVNVTLEQLKLERENIRKEGKIINRRRLMEIVTLGSIVLINCICLVIFLLK